MSEWSFKLLVFFYIIKFWMMCYDFIFYKFKTGIDMFMIKMLSNI